MNLTKPLVLNSTPLIYLSKVSLSVLFSEIPEQKFTTPAVYHETVEKGEGKGAPEAEILKSLFENTVIQIYRLRDRRLAENLIKVAAKIEEQPLHEAEAEVLAAAKELNRVVIADDHVARSVAILFGIELHGTGYLLGRMYSIGKITKKALVEKVREMRSLGWHVSAEDYLDIIDYLRALP